MITVYAVLGVIDAAPIEGFSQPLGIFSDSTVADQVAADARQSGDFYDVTVFEYELNGTKQPVEC